MPASQFVALGLSALGVVVAVWLLAAGIHGRAKVTGIIGSAFLLLGVLNRYAYQLVLSRVLVGADDDTVLKTLAAQTVTGSLLTGIGILFLTYALVVASRLPRASRTPGR
jgi:hypothetical protein